MRQRHADPAVIRMGVGALELDVAAVQSKSGCWRPLDLAHAERGFMLVMHLPVLASSGNQPVERQRFQRPKAEFGKARSAESPTVALLRHVATVLGEGPILMTQRGQRSLRSPCRCSEDVRRRGASKTGISSS